MVIAESSSDSTLVSLQDRQKDLYHSVILEVADSIPPRHVLGPETRWTRTELFLPEDGGRDETPSQTVLILPPPEDRFDRHHPAEYFSSDDDDDFHLGPDDHYDTSFCHEAKVDEFLQHWEPAAALRRRNETLLQSPVVRLSPSTAAAHDRILYVGQGELAHTLPSQCDVLVSDKATTCHILLVVSRPLTNDRSSSSSTPYEPLYSLTHLDDTCYDTCLRSSIIQHHKNYHHQQQCSVPSKRRRRKLQKEGAQDDATMMDMQIHILGGFLDDKGTSQELSRWLLYALAELAHQERASIRMTLATCAVSSMNHERRCHLGGSLVAAPRGRGLAVDLRTGQVFLASCHDELAGPAGQLRAARLWASMSSASNSDDDDDEAGNSPCQRRRTLQVIHEESRGGVVTVAPFNFSPLPQTNTFLSLPDRWLLQYTSTSPECEEEDFCQHVRSTLIFLREARPNQIFGPQVTQPLVLRRVGRRGPKANHWERI